MTVRSLFITLALACTTIAAQAQFGYGFTINNDLYIRATNPEADLGGSAGSAILNLGVGPKIWFGGQDFSMSVEATAMIAPLALDVDDYKGMGMAAFPIMAKLNFGGMTCLDKEGELGFHLGGGVQHTRTELYRVQSDFKAQGGSRSLFDTYIVQAGYGFGMSGFALSLYSRYGWNPDSKARLFSIGLQFDFNTPMLRQITSEESSL